MRAFHNIETSGKGVVLMDAPCAPTKDKQGSTTDLQSQERSYDREHPLMYFRTRSFRDITVKTIPQSWSPDDTGNQWSCYKTGFMYSPSLKSVSITNYGYMNTCQLGDLLANCKV